MLHLAPRKDLRSPGTSTVLGFLHEHCSFLVVPDTLQARRGSEDNSCYADAIRSDPIDEM